MAGGGSGGHITPLLAVANRLKQDHPNTRVIAITERRGVFNHIFDGENQLDKLRFISAGKYRRYHGQSWVSKIFDLKTIFFNIRDSFKLAIGTLECLIILSRDRPDVIFIKGGYVGVPVGMAARLLKIPYITHDSDAIPGLTNRLIGKNAVLNAVGMPPEFYNYPKEKIVFVGVPVTDDFINPSNEYRLNKRRELDIARDDFMLLITGGSNGAKRLDEIVHTALEHLLVKYPHLNVVHQVGKHNENIYEDYPLKLHSRIRVATFFSPLSSYIAAADLVIARAGATAIAEIGHLLTPLIVVPNPYLSAGHQIKNAKVLEKSKSAIVIPEDDAESNPLLLQKAVIDLIESADVRAKLSKNLYSLTKKDACKKISDLLVDIAKKRKPE